MTRGALTVHLVRARVDESAGDDGLVLVDLGRVTHEVTPAQLFRALPDDLDTEREEWWVAELWEETERVRWLLDEREIDDALAMDLTEGEAWDLLATARPRVA